MIFTYALIKGSKWRLSVLAIRCLSIFAHHPFTGYGVFPNPVIGQGFTLELDEPLHAVLHLYSRAGMKIGLERRGVSDQQVKLTPLAKLAPGIHVLTVSERGTTRIHRFLAQ